MITFDHIAIAAPTLQSGAAYVQAQTGITPPAGGKHPLMGTHNLLSSLGTDTFLEVIAIDSAAPKPPHKRWFDLDNPALQTRKPQVHAWLLRSDDIARDLSIAREHGVDLGTPLALTRDALSWRFAVRADGTIPLDRAAPLLLQWDKMDAHPAATMTDQGLRLTSLEIATPNTTRLVKLLTAWGLEHPPKISQSPTPQITAKFATASGKEVTLQ